MAVGQQGQRMLLPHNNSLYTQCCRAAPTLMAGGRGSDQPIALKQGTGSQAACLGSVSGGQGLTCSECPK